ncbi:coactosin-like protein [Glandiceps talaboti]
MESNTELAASDAYETVRSDSNDIIWAALNYDGKEIVIDGTGTSFGELHAKFTKDSRVYAYLRVETGDEMSRRAKFAFITWIGPSVSPLLKAKVSTDKAFVKQIWSHFGKEFLLDEIEPNLLVLEKITKVLEKASGAAYGTGK